MLFQQACYPIRPLGCSRFEDVSAPTSDTLTSPQHILPPLCFQFCDNPKESISFPSVLSFTSLWKDPTRDRTPGCFQGRGANPHPSAELRSALPGSQLACSAGRQQWCWSRPLTSADNSGTREHCVLVLLSITYKFRKSRETLLCLCLSITRFNSKADSPAAGCWPLTLGGCRHQRQ